jgi:hypothetical protein
MVSKRADYKLKSILILFGGVIEKFSDIKRECKIVDIAKKNQISLINEL